jgi:hypothetical protein
MRIERALKRRSKPTGGISVHCVCGRWVRLRIDGTLSVHEPKLPQEGVFCRLSRKPVRTKRLVSSPE